MVVRAKETCRHNTTKGLLKTRDDMTQRRGCHRHCRRRPLRLCCCLRAYAWGHLRVPIASVWCRTGAVVFIKTLCCSDHLASPKMREKHGLTGSLLQASGRSLWGGPSLRHFALVTLGSLGSMGAGAGNSWCVTGLGRVWSPKRYGLGWTSKPYRPLKRNFATHES